MMRLTRAISRALYAIQFKVYPPPKQPPHWLTWLCRRSMQLEWYFIRPKSKRGAQLSFRPLTEKEIEHAIKLAKKHGLEEE
jgi:hypothetical protein